VKHDCHPSPREMMESSEKLSTIRFLTSHLMKGINDGLRCDGGLLRLFGGCSARGKLVFMASTEFTTPVPAEELFLIGCRKCSICAKIANIADFARRRTVSLALNVMDS
jgi:hypothetical protein